MAGSKKSKKASEGNTQEPEATHVRGINCPPLHDLNLTIPQGKLSLLRGPSAAGKTRILRDILLAESLYRRKMAHDPGFLREPANITEKPDIRQIANLPRVKYIQPQTAPTSRQSLAQYLGLPRLLVEYLRSQLPLPCPVCGRTGSGKVRAFSAGQLATRLTSEGPKGLLQITACFKSGAANDRPTPRDVLIKKLLDAGHEALLLEGESSTIAPLSPDTRWSDQQTLHVIIDRLRADKAKHSRLSEAVRIAECSGADCLGVLSPESVVHYPFTLACDKCSFQPGALCPENLLPLCQSSTAPGWLSFNIGNISIADIYDKQLQELPLLPEIPDLQARMSAMQASGLGQLRLSSELRSISPGEYYRLNMLAAISEPHRQLLLALDQPSSLLGTVELVELLKVLRQKTGQAFSCILADNDESLLPLCDGAAALTNGLPPGTTLEFASAVPATVSSATISEQATGQSAAHITLPLAGHELAVPAYGITCLKDATGGDPLRFYDKIHTALLQNPALTLKQSALTFEPAGASSSLSTWMNLSEPIAKLLAKLEISRIKGLTPRVFKLLLQGNSRRQGLADLTGLRLHGFRLLELLDLPLRDIADAFSAIPACQAQLSILEALNLLHLPLGAALACLSSGELSRLRIAKALLGTVSAPPRAADGRTPVLLLDRPAAFLDAQESANMAAALSTLAGDRCCLLALEQNRFFYQAVHSVITI